MLLNHKQLPRIPLLQSLSYSPLLSLGNINRCKSPSINNMLSSTTHQQRSTFIADTKVQDYYHIKNEKKNSGAKIQLAAFSVLFSLLYQRATKLNISTSKNHHNIALYLICFSVELILFKHLTLHKECVLIRFSTGSLHVSASKLAGNVLV